MGSEEGTLDSLTAPRRSIFYGGELRKFLTSSMTQTLIAPILVEAQLVPRHTRHLH